MAGCAAVLTADGLSSTGVARGTSCDRDNSLSGRVQEIASEVLRLRLVQSQHRQLEGQLRGAAENLQRLSPEKMLHLRNYLEMGFRAGAAGTLGGMSGGVGPDGLCGLMECLCTVCGVRLPSRRHEDLLSATRRLLQDPAALQARLSALEPASSVLSRRLAPFLLSCDSSWRGYLNEAGQCYEAIRTWLSCYYQYSLISGQVQATNEQLLEQERLMTELGRDTEGGTGSSVPGLGKVGTWRQQSGVRRSSSVQSNSSVGSHRSQSPSKDALSARFRHSPRTSGIGLGINRPTGASTARESPLKTTGLSSARGGMTERTVRTNGYSYGGAPLQPLHAPRGHGATPARSKSPTDQSGGHHRSSMAPRGEKVEASPRQQRFVGSSGAISARTGGRSSGIGGTNYSPRVGGPVGHKATLSARRIDERMAAEHGLPTEAPMGSPRTGVCATSASMARSKSLQSINEPIDTTPPLSSRARPGDPQTARLQTARSQILTPLGGGRVAPHTARAPASTAQPLHRVSRLSSGGGYAPSAGSGGTPGQSAAHMVPVTGPTMSGPATVTVTPASAGGTVQLRRSQHTRSSLLLPGGRRPQEHVTVATRHTGDAGSGGTGGGGGGYEWGSQLASRSSPALEVRMAQTAHRPLARPAVRPSAATPRPVVPAPAHGQSRLR